MPDTPPFKLACIGTHGVGKTTLCYDLAARLKARDVPLEVVHEVARRCPLPINRDTTRAAQSWILHTQIAEEILASARYPVVLCDRSVLDNYAYLLLAAGPQPTLDALLDPWLQTYDLLIHVPIVEPPDPDGIRSLDPGFRRAVEQRLDLELQHRGHLPVLRLDPAERPRWTDRILEELDDHLGPGQLELL